MTRDPHIAALMERICQPCQQKLTDYYLAHPTKGKLSIALYALRNLCVQCKSLLLQEGRRRGR